MKTLVKPTVIDTKNEDQYQALALCPELGTCECFNVCKSKYFSDEENDDILF